MVNADEQLPKSSSEPSPSRWWQDKDFLRWLQFNYFLTLLVCSAIFITAWLCPRSFIANDQGANKGNSIPAQSGTPDNKNTNEQSHTEDRSISVAVALKGLADEIDKAPPSGIDYKKWLLDKVDLWLQDGKVSASTASDLKEEIGKALVEVGKDGAKKAIEALIKKYIDKPEEKKSASGVNASIGDIRIVIDNGAIYRIPTTQTTHHKSTCHCQYCCESKGASASSVSAASPASASTSASSPPR